MADFLKGIVDTLKAKKVEYGDARIVERESESIVLKNGIIEAISRTTDTGFGIRVLKDSAWGFSSSNHIDKKKADKIIEDALDIARVSALVKAQGVSLTPLPPQKGVYRTKMKIDPMAVPLGEKIDLLIACDKIMAAQKKTRVRISFLKFKKTKIAFVSTDGSSTNQEMVISGGGLKVFAMDGDELQSRSYEDYRQSGYEFINLMDFKNNASRINEEAVMLLNAKSCPAMETTVIIDSDQMVLQVHESCGHPTELDRVLGTEASYAGTSFLTVDKLNRFQYGSELVNIVADATVPGGLGTFGWDDEGVPGQRFHLVKDGQFVGYLSSRETAHVINSHSSGTMRADNWNRIPLIRMTNINLEPGKWKLKDMIADTRDGVFMATNKSWSIDDKRLNFQFGCEFARRIKNGKLAEVYKNPTYAGITPQFWRNCNALGNKESWHLYGVTNCGKGEPGQIMSVGHGTVPARFRKVQIGIVQ